MVYITDSNATFVQSYIIIAVVLEIYRITLRVQIQIYLQCLRATRRRVSSQFF